MLNENVGDNADEQSSRSLDDLELNKQEELEKRMSQTRGAEMAGGVNGLPGVAGHRRAKSSIGMNRKASGKTKDGLPKHPPGPLA